MSSIGPQLPQLSKRKRTPDDEGTADSPPSKKTAGNQDEIALDDESSEDDTYGPSIPNPPTAANPPPLRPSRPAPEEDPKPTVGPTLPPPVPPPNTNEIALDDSDTDTTGPAPQPQAVPALPRRILGPAPPPAALSERPPQPADADADSDSDSDYGPALPTSSAHLARQSQAATAATSASAQRSQAPQRDDWMLAPPRGDSARRADPTQIKARKFNSGPRAGGGSGGGSGGNEISSIWTETPEQKRQRLENAVLGRSSGDGPSSTSTHSKASAKDSSAEDEETARIRANLEAARGPSLYAEHQKREGGKGGRIEAEEDDPSKRGFDWEKDMKSGGGKIGSAQRRELLNRATDFGGRFSKGKYL